LWSWDRTSDLSREALNGANRSSRKASAVQDVQELRPAQRVEGTKPNLKKINEYVDRSLMLVTALSPVIGYDKASKIAHYAMDNDLTLKVAALKLGFVTEAEFDRDRSKEDGDALRGHRWSRSSRKTLWPAPPSPHAARPSASAATVQARPAPRPRLRKNRRSDEMTLPWADFAHGDRVMSAKPRGAGRFLSDLHM
jgi:hypothetical protein